MDEPLAIAAGISALAGATGAVAAWRNVLLSHRPYLVGDYAGGSQLVPMLDVMNVGGGTAINVYAILRGPSGEELDAQERRRTLRVGEYVRMSFPSSVPIDDYKPWTAVVRYDGTGGDQWTATMPLDRRDTASRKRRRSR